MFTSSLENISVTIDNTVVSHSTLYGAKAFLSTERVKIDLIGPVLFHNISNINDTIIFAHSSNITCSSYIEFTNVTGRTILA